MILFILFSLGCLAADVAVCMNINVSHVYLHKVDKHFLSVGVGLDRMVQQPQRDFNKIRKVLVVAARGLAPAYFRVGGTRSDFAMFVLHKKKPKTYPNIIQYRPKDLKKIFSFVSQARMSLIFDLNLLTRKSDGGWDSSNTKKLFNYLQNEGVSPSCWQLGNEPNHLSLHSNTSVSATQLFADLVILKRTLSGYLNLTRCILAPEVTSPPHNKFMDGHSTPGEVYLENFVKAGRSGYLEAISWHHYYLNGKTATMKRYLSPDTLDNLQMCIDKMKAASAKSKTPHSMWITEGASASSGGSKNLSDTFISGYLWLNKLGVTARSGVKMVTRYAFYGGHNGLIDIKGNILPDYWLSYLHRSLVGRRVLAVTASSSSPGIRVFAHCAAQKRKQHSPKGSIVFIVLSVISGDVDLVLDGPASRVMSYVLTPTADMQAVHTGDLSSRRSYLNGELLALTDRGKLPDIHPVVKVSGKIVIPGYSLGFYVLPDVNNPACI